MLSSVTEAILAFGQSSTPPGELIMTASGFMLRQEINTQLRSQEARLGVSLESLCLRGLGAGAVTSAAATVSR